MKRRDILKFAAASIITTPVAAIAAAARNTKTEIVVIGSVGAGFSAAITAHDLGAKVIVLEKMPITGGNTQIASGGMSAAGTRYQAAKGIKDSWEAMYEDTFKGGQNRGIPALVEILAKNSAASLDWLVSFGADLSLVSRGGGASVDRSHGPKDGGPVGPQIMKALRAAAARRNIDVRTNSDVLHIITNTNGAASGVLVRERTRHLYEIEAKALILASGGFAANLQMVTKYHPEYAGFSTSNQPGAIGDGILLGNEVGVQLRDMDQIQIHPTLAAGTNILVSEASRGVGAILVNREGKRFVNEITTRDATSAAVLQQTGKTAFLIFDEGLRKKMTLMEGYFHLSFVKRGATPEALAQAIGVDPATFATTIGNYNKYQQNKLDPDFKRPDMPRPIDEPNYYSIEIQPGIHYTMGGVLFNEHAQAVAKNGKSISGLYAAGEVTGGVHGSNRLMGNSTSETITFGRIAGREAAQYVRSV
jgi:fumarate reductase flavoprotein subunit